MPRYYSVEEVHDILWDFIKANGGIHPAARLLGVSTPYLYMYAKGERAHGKPGEKIAEKLGLQRVTAYIGPNTYTLPTLSPPTEKEPTE